MSSLTPEQRAKIGGIREQWEILMTRAVDELLERPDYIDRARRPVVGLRTESGTLNWWGTELDTAE